MLRNDRSSYGGECVANTYADAQSDSHGHAYTGTNSYPRQHQHSGLCQTGNNVMIGGFIIEGTEPKTVIIRAIGPELGCTTL